MEHEEKERRLAREADRMEDESELVEEDIEKARREWEGKQQDPSVPGAQPEPGSEEESIPGVESDEDELRDQPGP
jgi:hypothetical protein